MRILQNMKLSYILFLIFGFSFLNPETDGFVGKYYSIDNKFERFSGMELTENGRFVYKYALGACQGYVEGSYTIIKHHIKFKNDYKYTIEYLKKERDSLKIVDSMLIVNNPDFAKIYDLYPFIPDLSLTEWIIKSNSIRPILPIDCGCVIERGKHKKINVR